MIRDYNKFLNIKDVTTGNIVCTIEYQDFNWGEIMKDSYSLGFLDLKIGHLYMLQEILKILGSDHDVYIFTGYKDQ